MTTLTEKEKIELLATKLMGWEKAFCKINSNSKITTSDFWADSLGELYGIDFNPYQDWNHTHMVLEKVTYDVKLWENLIVDISMSNRAGINQVGYYMMHTKEQLMDAVISLIQS